MPDPPKAPGKTENIMSKKILGIPLPIAIAVVAVAGYFVYRHYKTTSAANTSGTSQSTSVDPNAIDPATGLTYGAEQQAGLNAMGGPSTNGTGGGGVGGGLSLGDLEGLLSSLSGLGATNYYYGNGGNPTPAFTNSEAGNGAQTALGVNSSGSPSPVISPSGFAQTGPNLSSTTPLYSVGGTLFTVGQSGALQPAYGGVQPDTFVSPETYAGLGVTPSPITGVSPPTTVSANTVQPEPIRALPESQFGTPAANVPVHISNISTSPAEVGHPGGYSSNKKQGVYATH